MSVEANSQKKPRVLPLVYLLATVAVMTALHYFLPIARLLTPPASYIGVIIVVIGIGLGVVSAGAFVRAGTPMLPFAKSTAVVTTGLYRHTRNPMYLGMVVFLFGVACLLGSVVTIVPVMVFFGILDRQFIRREEIFLEQIFGEQYLDYRSRVRRWL